jgi:tRNA threonylcarbamoyl adenosine modification protein (Sua5/YciO/YrdC/YwlC family)
MKQIILTDDSLDSAVRAAVDVIGAGGIVAMPFDTVYGFVCDPFSSAAVDSLNLLKGRSANKTIGIAVSSVSDLKNIVETDQEIEQFISLKTPGKFTFILNEKPGNAISDLCKRDGTIGVRIPDSDLVLAVAEASGGYLAQTSANKSGEPNCYSVDEIKAQFSESEIESVGLIIDGGKIESTAPSEIWNLTKNPFEKIERS